MRFSNLALLAATASVASGFTPFQRQFTVPSRTVVRGSGYDLDLGDITFDAPPPTPEPPQKKRAPKKEREVKPAPAPPAPKEKVKAEKVVREKPSPPPRNWSRIGCLTVRALWARRRRRGIACCHP